MMGEVLVRYGESAKDTATLLLGAADDLELEAYVVRHQPDDGGFRVPEEVAKKAKLDTADEDAEAAEEEKTRQKQIEVIQAQNGVDAEGKPVDTDAEPKKAPAKKTAKKAPAKRTAKKTTTAKKTAAKSESK